MSGSEMWGPEDGLEERRDRLKFELGGLKSKLKPQASFSLEYWRLRLRIGETLEEIARLTISINEGGQDNGRGADIRAEIVALQLGIKLMRKHVETLEKAKSGRRAFIQLFTTSKLGLDIKTTGTGKRGQFNQTSFRKDLLEVSGCMHPTKDALWCPILGQFFDSEQVIAAHVFPHFHGRELMMLIFGKDELFSSRNGILMYKGAEERFNKGRFVVIPAAPSGSLQLKDISWWGLQEPQEYRIHVVEGQTADMTKTILWDGQKTWSQLDGELLQFKSSFRPRARYFYFHYVCTMLKHAWKQQKHIRALQDELGLPFWATPGTYVERKMVLAFPIEKVGHEYNFAGLESSTVMSPEEMGQECDVSSSTMLEAVTGAFVQQIEESAKKTLQFDEEEGEEEEGEGEEE